MLDVCCSHGLAHTVDIVCVEMVVRGQQSRRAAVSEPAPNMETFSDLPFRVSPVQSISPVENSNSIKK